MCGENADLLANYLPDAGSSPRVRGKHPTRTSRWGLSGLIPACAGKTRRRRRSRLPVRAHPRVCGENLEETDDAMRMLGSSPRVRGKRSHERNNALSDGLIPACAGKTLNDLEF